MNKDYSKKFLFIALIMLLAFSLIACSSEPSKDEGGEDKPLVEDESEQDEEDEPEEEEEEVEEDDLAEGVAEKDSFGPGIYEVGVDIPSGEYKYYPAEEGRTAFFRVGPNIKMESIDYISSGHTESFAYFSVSKGQFLELKKAKALPVEKSEAYDHDGGNYEEAEYKIGVDMPAGEYKIFAEEDRGYFKLSKDSRGVMDSVSANKNFDSFVYVTVEDGQFLQLSRAYALPIEKAEAYKSTGGYEAGEYKVGFDMPAGDYTLKKEDGENLGLVQIYKSSVKTLDNRRVDETFEDETMNISVKDGEILLIEYAFIE